MKDTGENTTLPCNGKHSKLNITGAKRCCLRQENNHSVIKLMNAIRTPRRYIVW